MLISLTCAMVLSFHLKDDYLTLSLKRLNAKHSLRYRMVSTWMSKLIPFLWFSIKNHVPSTFFTTQFWNRTNQSSDWLVIHVFFLLARVAILVLVFQRSIENHSYCSLKFIRALMDTGTPDNSAIIPRITTKESTQTWRIFRRLYLSLKRKIIGKM